MYVEFDVIAGRLNVSLDVPSVDLDYKSIMLDVWMNVCDDLEDIILNIPAFEWACAINAGDVH